LATPVYFLNQETPFLWVLFF